MNTDLQDKTPPVAQDTIRQKARDAVFMRAGDVSDKQEVLGEYTLQFGQYKGKTFRWLLENDVSYTLFWINKVEGEAKANLAREAGPKKDSILTFCQYAKSFQEVQDLIQYKSDKPPELSVSAEDDNLVGFGKNAKKTWREVWESRADGYAAFILKKQCVEGTRMHALQQYLAKKSSTPGAATARATATTTAPATTAATAPALPPATVAATAPAPASSDLPGLLRTVYKQRSSPLLSIVS